MAERVQVSFMARAKRNARKLRGPSRESRTPSTAPTDTVRLKRDIARERARTQEELIAGNPRAADRHQRVQHAESVLEEARRGGKKRPASDSVRAGQSRALAPRDGMFDKAAKRVRELLTR